VTNSSLYNKQGFGIFVQRIPLCWWKLPNEPPWHGGVTHPKEVRAHLQDVRMSGSSSTHFSTYPAAGTRAGAVHAAVPGWKQAEEPTFSSFSSLDHTQQVLFSELDVAGPLKSDLRLVIRSPPGAVMGCFLPSSFQTRCGGLFTTKLIAAGIRIQPLFLPQHNEMGSYVPSGGTSTPGRVEMCLMRHCHLTPHLSFPSLLSKF